MGREWNTSSSASSTRKGYRGLPPPGPGRRRGQTKSSSRARRRGDGRPGPVGCRDLVGSGLVAVTLPGGLGGLCGVVGLAPVDLALALALVVGLGLGLLDGLAPGLAIVGGPWPDEAGDGLDLDPQVGPVLGREAVGDGDVVEVGDRGRVGVAQLGVEGGLEQPVGGHVERRQRLVGGEAVVVAVVDPLEGGIDDGRHPFLVDRRHHQLTVVGPGVGDAVGEQAGVELGLDVGVEVLDLERDPLDVVVVGELQHLLALERGDQLVDGVLVGGRHHEGPGLPHPPDPGPVEHPLQGDLELVAPAIELVADLVTLAERLAHRAGAGLLGVGLDVVGQDQVAVDAPADRCHVLRSALRAAPGGHGRSFARTVGAT